MEGSLCRVLFIRTCGWIVPIKMCIHFGKWREIGTFSASGCGYQGLQMVLCAELSFSYTYKASRVDVVMLSVIILHLIVSTVYVDLSGSGEGYVLYLQITLWLQGLFQFAMVWSIGSTLTGDSRRLFDEFFRSLINGMNPDHPKPKSCKITKVLESSLLSSVLNYFISSLVSSVCN